MALVLVATESGFRSFTDSGEAEPELEGRPIQAVSREVGDSCLAVVDVQEIWRRDLFGAWTKVVETGASVQSITSVDGMIFAGGMDEAVLLRISASGRVERLSSFDNMAGRGKWFAGGPPLGVRGLTATAGGSVLLAAVHVGGIPLSVDAGETWTPTVPVMFDIHEVRAHPSSSNFVAAAAAVGLCLSEDGGRSWAVVQKNVEGMSSLAVAVLEDEVLFSVQEGPFAKRSQVWRWSIGGRVVEPVRDGLPEWLDGRVDTNWIVAGKGRVAILDGGGNLWLSTSGSRGWERIATNLPYSFGLLMV
jgi:hypothetical protein